jgi:hypothetical protein
MDDLGRVLSPLERPLAEPPPLAQIERRARHLRRRRWAGRATAGAVVAVALIGAALAVVDQPGGDQTVRVASPGAAASGQVSPNTGVTPAEILIKEFDQGGHRWRIVSTGRCASLVNETGPVSGNCWPDPRATPLRAEAVELGDVWLLWGTASRDVTGVFLDGEESPSFALLGQNAGLEVHFFAVLLPPESDWDFTVVHPGVTKGTLTATLADGQTFIVHPLALPRAVPATVPTTIDITTPIDVTTTTAVVESPIAPVPTTTPSTTVPPPTGGGASQVDVVPGVVRLHEQPFDSAVAYGSQAVAVRWWGGVAPCDVLARVDAPLAGRTIVDGAA